MTVSVILLMVVVVVILIGSVMLDSKPMMKMAGAVGVCCAASVNGEINCENKPAKINPNISQITEDLYLTNYVNAKDYTSLKALGVRQILTIGAELPRHGEPFFKVMHIKLKDHPKESIQKYFNASYNFIKNAKTVVHCAAGISRSTTLVAAYLMRKYGIGAEQALAYILERRPIINPNQGFREQLAKFEKILQKNKDNEIDDTDYTDDTDGSDENE